MTTLRQRLQQKLRLRTTLLRPSDPIPLRSPISLVTFIIHRIRCPEEVRRYPLHLLKRTQAGVADHSGSHGRIAFLLHAHAA